jgi:Zn finger protein HypA/HybF involved in hydrogenase expression
MTNQEAISQLEEVNKETHIYSEAIDMAISALEKQIPMKPTTPEIGISPLHPIIIPCGNCEMALEVELEGMKKYCPWCGQAIDWEGE